MGFDNTLPPCVRSMKVSSHVRRRREKMGGRGEGCGQQ